MSSCFFIFCTCVAALIYQLIITGDCQCSCSSGSGCSYTTQNCTYSIYCTGSSGCRGSSSNYIATYGSSSARIFCDGYYGCYENGLISSTTDLYCRGLYSCALVTTIRADEDIYCSSRGSCYENSLIESKTGDIYCRSYQSCITDNGASITTLAGNIYCEGTESCVDGTISSSYVSTVIAAYDTVYCRGYYSCKGVDLVSMTANVECEGFSSCYFAHIYTKGNNGGSIYCNGKYSCYYADIFANATSSGATDSNIYCNSENSCDDSELTALYGTIYCNGKLSCVYAKILYIADTHLYIRGENATIGTSITLTDTISWNKDKYIFAENLFSLALSYITKNDNGTLTIYGHGRYSAYDSDIYVNHDDGSLECYGYGYHSFDNAYLRKNGDYGSANYYGYGSHSFYETRGYSFGKTNYLLLDGYRSGERSSWRFYGTISSTIEIYGREGALNANFYIY